MLTIPLYYVWMPPLANETNAIDAGAPSGPGVGIAKSRAKDEVQSELLATLKSIPADELTVDEIAERRTTPPSNLDGCIKGNMSHLSQFVIEVRAQRYGYISSEDMWCFLKILGAEDKDVPEFLDFWSEEKLNATHTETEYPYKLSAGAQYGFHKRSDDDAFNIQRHAHCTFAADPYAPGDAGNEKRDFPAPPWTVDSNSIAVAFRKFAFLMSDPRGVTLKGVNGSQQFNYTLRHFFDKTINRKESLGLPSLEGVHQDGGEVVLVSMIERANVKATTGISRIWNLNQPTGRYRHANRTNLLLETMLVKPFDTLVLMDRHVQHEGRKFEIEDDKSPATRSVQLLFSSRL